MVYSITVTGSGRRTHCWRGHPLSGDNLYVRPNSNDRHCNACRRFRDRLHQRRLCKRETALVRFSSRVYGEVNGCWRWMGARSNGYGIFCLVHQNNAHRAAYELFIGPIPQNLQTHHTCGNRACVNLWHLELVSRTEHMERHGLLHSNWGSDQHQQSYCVDVDAAKRFMKVVFDGVGSVPVQSSNMQ